MLLSGHRGWHDPRIHVDHKLSFLVWRGFFMERAIQTSLKLKAVVHTGDPKLFAEAMRSYPRIKDLNTRNCALEGSQLFGSTKRILNLPLGSEWFSSSNKVNYFIPHLNTRSMRARIDESFKHDENVVSHTTTMLESECPESQWYISQLPYLSKKESQALQANTKHPCRAKVGKSTHGILAPTYTCMNIKIPFQQPHSFEFLVLCRWH